MLTPVLVCPTLVADFLNTLGYIAEYWTVPTAEDVRGVGMKDAFSFLKHLEHDQHLCTC